MKIKKYLSVILMVSILVSIVSISAYATTYSPMFTNISSIDNGLSANGKTLYVDAATYGDFDINSCGVTATLQKQSGSNWTNYKVWSATSPASHPDYVEISTSIVVSAGTYRLVSSHSATMGSYTEYAGMTSDIVTVS